MKYSLLLISCLVCSLVYVPASAEWIPQNIVPYEIVNSHSEVEVDEKGLEKSVDEIELRALNENGRAALVMQAVPFVPDAETVKVTKASSVTDGVESMVDLKTIATRTGKSLDQGVSHFKEYVISFPNVKIGTIVKYTVTRKKLKNLVPGLYSMTYVFGHGTPELAGSARIKSKIPLFADQMDPWQVSDLSYKTEGGFHIIEIKQKRPIFKYPNEFNPVFDSDSLARIQISSMKDWAAYSSSIAKRYEVILSQKLPPQLVEISKKAKKGKTLEEKIDIVTSELSTVMTYAGEWTSFEKLHFPKSLSAIASKKTGDCKDFSLATIAVLRNLGIQAYPAFTNRKNNKSELGVISYVNGSRLVMDIFNHAIVKVKDGGRAVWVDPTNIVSDAGYIFPDIAGSDAIEISDKATVLEKIPLPASTKSRITYARDIKIKEDQSAESVTSFEMSGEFSKVVHELSLQKNGSEGEKVLGGLLRSLDKSAKAFYEGINLQSRLSNKLKGTQKVYGERILAEKEGKLYMSLAAPLTLLGFTRFTKPRVTSGSMYSKFSEATVTRVHGYDFVGFPQECTILTPWFTMRRSFIKKDFGFEIREEAVSESDTLSIADINSDKFQMHVGDVVNCVRGSNVEVRKLSGAEDLASRLADYTPEKMKNLSNASGPGSITAFENMYHIASQVLSTHPENKEALVAKARAFRLVGYKHSNVDRTEYQNEYNSSIQVLEKLYPDDLEVKILRARYWIRAEKYSEAARAFKKFYSPDMKSYEGFFVGGLVAIGLNQPKVALGAFQKSLQFTTDKLEQAAAYAQMGDTYMELKDIETAISFYKKSLSLNPENTWMQGNLVDHLVKLKRWDEAIDEGEKMLKVADFGIGRRQLARAYGGKAKSIQEDAMSKDPTMKTADYKSALLEVEANFLKAVKHAPDDTYTLFDLGAFYSNQAKASGDSIVARKSIGLYEKVEKSEYASRIPEAFLMHEKKDLQQIVDGKWKSRERYPASLPGGVQETPGTHFELRKIKKLVPSTSKEL